MHQTNWTRPTGDHMASRPRGVPRVEQLLTALRRDLADGRYRVGDMLPPSRAAAAELGCSRWTVVRAYELLAAEGLVEAHVGRGTRVVRSPSLSAGPGPTVAPATPAHVDRVVDLYPGLPDLRAFPLASWRSAVLESSAALRTADLGHADWRGLPGLRSALGDHARRVRGAVVDERTEVLVTAGVRDGFARILGALHEAGHRWVAAEDPGWLRLHDVATRAGMRLVPLPVDEEGARTDLLDAHPETRLVLVTPAHQFPEGVALSDARRRQLVRWARARDGYVIEDDYDSEFRFGRRPTPCLQRLAPERVVMLGTFNKTIAPAVGIGTMIVPRRLLDDRWPLPGQPPSTLVQAPMEAFVRHGRLDRYLQRRRAAHRRTRSVFTTALGALGHAGVSIGGIDAGLHLLLRVPPSVSRDELATALLTAGVRVPFRDDYTYAPPSGEPALVVGYGHLSERESKEAAHRLARALRAAIDGVASRAAHPLVGSHSSRPG